MLPLPAEAISLPSISSVFGGQALAQEENPRPVDNLQTMALLQPTPASIRTASDEEINSSMVADNNALVPSSNAVEAITGSPAQNIFSGETSIYVVRGGDTLDQIAKMFGVTVDTILSANDLKKGAKLKEGDILLILPYSGVEYTVVKGDTLESIAKKHKVALNDILSANDIDSGTKILPGEKLMIPGASMLVEAPKSTGSTSSKSSTGSSGATVDTTGYFSHPLPGARRTRGIIPRVHKGVDLAARAGTPILAAADGTVEIARYGWNGGFGNYVVIKHSNGTRTLYAHMSKLGTSYGTKVEKGEVIGYVGNTGRSRGDHLHFEVLGGKNPF